MNAEVARAVLPRRVVVEGRPHVVPAPTVATASVLVAAAPGAERGDAEDVIVWSDTLRAWLPEALARDVLDEALPWTYRASIVARLLFEGAPLPRPAVARMAGSQDSSGEDEDLFARMARFDTADAVSRVAAAYHCNPDDVLDGLWPRFLLWLREAPRVEARRELSALTLAALPHMSDEHERSAILDRLRTLAGANDAEAAMTVEEKIRRGEAAADALRRVMGVP